MSSLLLLLHSLLLVKDQRHAAGVGVVGVVVVKIFPPCTFNFFFQIKCHLNSSCNVCLRLASQFCPQRTPASVVLDSQSRDGFSTQTSTPRYRHNQLLISIYPKISCQAVETAVARQFSPAVRQPLVAEWFRSSLPSPAPGEEETLDR